MMARPTSRKASYKVIIICRGGSEKEFVLGTRWERGRRDGGGMGEKRSLVENFLSANRYL